jgi:hypothetical protein
MVTLLALLLLGCSTSDSASCSAMFELTFPDGSPAAMDACEQIDAVGSSELDPNDPSAFRSAVVKLSASTDLDADCWIQVTLSGMCGAGSYEIGTGSQLLWATNDCSGIPDELVARGQTPLGRRDLLGRLPLLGRLGDEGRVAGHAAV